MMNLPLISVLIPVYNHEKFISTCLNSVLHDNYSNKEIIIINDGSTDNSEQRILDWLQENREHTLGKVTYLSQANQGICKTLNKLVSLAQGEFVKLLSSDDYLLPNMLQHQVDFLLANQEKMVILSDSLVVDESDKIIYPSFIADFIKKDKKSYQTDEKLRYQIIAHWGIPSISALIRKEIYKHFQYDEKLMIEDLDFYLFAISRNSLAYFDKVTVAYRIHDANNSAVSKKIPCDKRIRLLADVEKILIKYKNLFSKEYRELINSQIYLTRAKVAYLKKHWRTVLINMAGFGFLTLKAQSMLRINKFIKSKLKNSMNLMENK